MFQTTNQLPVIYFTQIHKLDQGHTVADIKEQDIDDIWMPNRYDFPYCSYLDVTGKWRKDREAKCWLYATFLAHPSSKSAQTKQTAQPWVHLY